MSCNLRQFCFLNDLKSLKQILIPDFQTIQERNRDDDYDNRWNWTTTQLLDSTEESSESSEWMSRLMSSLVAISPFADLMVFAKNSYLAVYRLKDTNDSNPNSGQNSTIDSNTQLSREMQLSFETQLVGGQHSTEVITSVLLVPIVSQQKSSFAFHDWTALIIGFSSGYIRIYTENGGLLLSQLLHNEPVIDIKCQTFRANCAPNDCDQLLVVYKTTAVLVDGFSLYQTLRLCRNRLAKTQSSGSSVALSAVTDSSLVFSYKKWKLEGSEDIQDCHNCGLSSRTMFDHLVSQSLERGPYGSPQSNSPSANLLITCGENPFVGFYRAHEGSTAILNELTQAMVNKVKNMIPFNIFGGNKANDSQTPTIEPSISVPLRVGLFDQRQGLSISVSPNKRLAAVVDDFGRVTLIDIDQWLAVRMWKGYREAQVGWIEVEEQPNTGPKTKKVSFLIIYAPKRGILEIWCTQMGPRVGAFNVGKNCKLIQCQHSMMGLNALLWEQFKSVSELEKSRCFLFDYNSGAVYDIEIPFLCALTDRNSKRTRDLHLFRELTHLLDNKTICTEKVVELVLMLRTADIRKDSLKAICLVPDIDVIKETTNQLKSHLMSSLVKNELDFENKLIAQMCSRIIQLIQFYANIKSLKIIENSYMSESSQPPDIQCLIDGLDWTGSDIARVLSLIAFRDALNKTVRNGTNSCTENDVNIADILSHFTLFSNHIIKIKDQEVYSDVEIELNIDLTENKLQTNRLLILSNFIFTPYLQTNGLDLETLLKSSAILPSNLLILLFISWLSSQFCNYWKCWQYFSQTLDVLMNIIGQERKERSDRIEISEDENDLLSDNWTEILELIYESENIMAALIAVHMIKAVNSKSKEKVEAKGLDNCPDMEWETLNIDNESLNLVIKQLEDLFLLDMLLRSRLNHNEEQQESDDSLTSHISLSYLLGSGPGIVSELVAKWAVNSNISPDVFYALIGEKSKAMEESEVDGICVGEEALDYQNMDIKTTTELLDHVRRCFPNCLESDVLLVNCCWELTVRWNKDPSVVDNSLEDSLKYLNYVSNSVLKHNVGCLLWKTFILKRFDCLCHLMEKMGKTPKDRICKKEIGINENRIEAFVEYSQQLLDLVLNSTLEAEREPMPLFSVDDWWKPQSSPLINQTVNQSVPLVILAVQKRTANGALVLEHWRLASIIRFIVTFQLKNSKPLSLFPTVVQQYFFKDLITFPVYSTNSDIYLSEKRKTFAFNVISAVVQTLPVHNESESKSEYFVNQSKLYSQANKWFREVADLSREWDLNVDEIRRKYVYELYFHGCDPLAEEAMTSVDDRISLGTELLVVAGNRVVNDINAKYGSVEQMHTLPTNVLFWLKSLNTDSNCYTGSPSGATIALLQHIHNYVYSDKTNSRICETLIETIRILNTNND